MSHFIIHNVIFPIIQKYKMPKEFKYIIIMLVNIPKPYIHNTVQTLNTMFMSPCSTCPALNGRSVQSFSDVVVPPPACAVGF